MTTALVALFLLLIAATFVVIGRLTMPATQRTALGQDLLASFRRGIVAVDHSAGTYIVTRAAAQR